ALEVFGKNPPVRILATDIDTNVLTKANQGVYDEAGMEKVPSQIIEKYFLKGKNANAGKVMVRPEVKELITFKQLNLLSPSWPMRGPFQVIF
ncbi:CheR family methyltransferase, partial [Acinetobacter baumannii]